MPTVDIPYPTTIRIGESALKDGSCYDLRNVRWVDNKLTTRCGAVRQITYVSEKEGEVAGEGLGVYMFRRNRRTPRLISVFRGNTEGDIEIGVSSGTQWIMQERLTLSGDMTDVCPASFVQNRNSVYIAGPFSTGMARFRSFFGHDASLELFKAEDRTTNEISPLGDEGPFLKSVPAFRYICEHQSRLYGWANDAPTTLRCSDLNDYDSYPTLNFLNLSEGGEIRGACTFGRGLLILKSTAAYLISGEASTQRNYQSEQVDPGTYTDGCVSPWSVQRTPYGVVYLGSRGVYCITPQLQCVSLTDGIRAIFTGERTFRDDSDSEYYTLDRQFFDTATAHYDPTTDSYQVQIPSTYTGSPLSTDSNAKRKPTISVVISFRGALQRTSVSFDRRSLFATHVDIDPRGRVTTYALGRAGDVQVIDVGSVDILRVPGLLEVQTTTQVVSVVGQVLTGNGERFRLQEVETTVQPDRVLDSSLSAVTINARADELVESFSNITLHKGLIMGGQRPVSSFDGVTFTAFRPRRMALRTGMSGKAGTSIEIWTQFCGTLARQRAILSIFKKGEGHDAK